MDRGDHGSSVDSAVVGHDNDTSRTGVVTRQMKMRKERNAPTAEEVRENGGGSEENDTEMETIGSRLRKRKSSTNVAPVSSNQKLAKRSFKCQICHQLFERKSQLTDHMSSHNELTSSTSNARTSGAELNVPDNRRYRVSYEDANGQIFVNVTPEVFSLLLD